MLNGLKTQHIDSWWPTNLHSLFQVFMKKGATKHSFQVFQHFLNQFEDCIDQNYIIAGLRALACHHSLLLKNKLLWYHKICNRNHEFELLTWEKLFKEFRINLCTFVNGSMMTKIFFFLKICINFKTYVVA